MTAFYLVFGHGSDYERTHHSRQRSDAIGDAHQYAGVTWGNIQMVNIKTCSFKTIKRKLIKQRCMLSDVDEAPVMRKHVISVI